MQLARLSTHSRTAFVCSLFLLIGGVLFSDFTASDSVRAHRAFKKAELEMRNHDTLSAMAQFSKALSFARKSKKDQSIVVGSLNYLAFLSSEKAKVGYQLEYISELEKAPVPDKHAIAAGFTSLGMTYQARGDFSKAERAYKHSLELLQGLNPRTKTIAINLSNMAKIKAEQIN